MKKKNIKHWWIIAGYRPDVLDYQWEKNTAKKSNIR